MYVKFIILSYSCTS